MKILHVFTLAVTAESFFDGQFAYLSDAGYNIHLIASTEPSKEFCQRNHITFHQIPVARRVDIKADITAIKALCKLIKREKFDAVFGHTPKGALVAMCAARLSGVKIRVYYRHGLIYTTATGAKRLIFKAVERFTAALATKIVNVSPSLSKLAVKDNLNSDNKQIVIGSGTCGGIDAENTFNPDKVDSGMISALRSGQKISKDDYVIGFCGRLCKDKGIRELIEGFRLFRKTHPSIRAKLLLIGGYDGRDILPESIHQTIDTDNDIISTGYILKNIQNYYALMDVFVFPSYREGFGMCVIEASAMKVPILVSRSHGCVDSIRENVTGRYIDISPESIASGLSDMLDVDLRHRLGKGGRQFVLNNFDHKVMWPLIKKFYDEIIFCKK